MRRNGAFGSALMVFAIGWALPLGAHEGHAHRQAPPDALAVTEKQTVGNSGGTYTSVPHWCKMPPGREQIGPTHGGVVVDRQGHIYWSMDGGPFGILVYKPDGSFVKGIAPGLTGLHDLTLVTEGDEQFIYAAHLKGRRAVKLKLDGTIVMTLGWPEASGKYKEEKQYRPTAIAVGPDGDIYVADGYGQNWIHQWDKQGKYLRSFGGRGKEPGRFATCHGLAVDYRGDKPLLLVCDRENRRLQHFDLEGNFVAVAAEGLRRPCAISFHGKRVAVAELEARVTILDALNRPIAHLGDNPHRKHWANYNVDPKDWKPGLFTAPHGVTFDAAGNLYVMDWNRSGRLSKLHWSLSQAGRVQARANAPDSKCEKCTPAGVSLAQEHN